MWNPPDVRDLLERRLRATASDLLRDPRMRVALDGHYKDSVNFLHQVIIEALSAAAKSGFAAAEATLRVAAQAHLQQRPNASVDQVRECLEFAMTTMELRDVPPAPPLDAGAWLPVGAAVGVALVGGAAGWLLGQAFVGLSIAAAASVLTGLWLARLASIRRAATAREMAANLPCQYSEHLKSVLDVAAVTYAERINSFGCSGAPE